MHALPQEKYIGNLEQVFAFYDAMPTGVTVSEDGRIFVCYPDWGDKSPFTVAEITGETVVPYPSADINAFHGNDPENTFVSVQSVVADGTGGLWVLDAAAPNFASPVPGGPKLVSVDLRTNRVRRTYTFSADVVLNTTYLNDVRVDYRAGAGGFAYITDSSAAGPGAIIVVDLADGTAVRRLSGHMSTSPDKGFLPKVEGKIMMNRPAGGQATPTFIAADGIALSPDGGMLYYSPLSSRRLYSIETAHLRDMTLSEAQLGAYVRDGGEKGASDGMITDANGVVYAGDYENNSIRAIMPDGSMKTIVHDPRVLWPDTLSIGPDGYLYFTANQLHRQAGYNHGQDVRQKPYSLFRVRIDAGPAPVR